MWEQSGCHGVPQAGEWRSALTEGVRQDVHMPTSDPTPAARQAYDELVEEVQHQADVKPSSMFGMPTVKNAAGKALFGLRDDSLVFKLPEAASHARAMALAGAHLFDPSGKRPMKEWVVLGLEHRALFLDFALASHRALAAGE